MSLIIFAKVFKWPFKDEKITLNHLKNEEKREKLTIVM